MISEKELEDYICEHPEAVFGTGTRILGRQIRLPHGVMDILAWNGDILVLELKRGCIKEAHVAQVLRYAGDIGDILRYMSRHFPEMKEDHPDDWYYYFCHGQWNHKDTCAIQPILIGRNATDKVLASALACGCYSIAWNANENGGLEFHPILPFGMHTIKTYPPWLLKLLEAITSQHGN